MVVQTDGKGADGEAGIGGRGLQRLGRALIGWIEPAKAALLLAGNRLGASLPEESRMKIVNAAAAVARRPAGFDQAGAVEPLPPTLEGHVAELASTTGGAGMFGDGWTVHLVDLARICAFQPTVFTDVPEDRLREIENEDWASLARLTLPTEAFGELPVQFDPDHKLFTVVAPNPNLRVVGHLAGPIPGGGNMPAFGFFVSVLPSYLQVASLGGRYYLRDGYHRAIALLSRGIQRAPAFVRNFQAVAQLAPAGMLPQEAFLGDRPPILVDYLDDAVSAPVSLPASQKMVLIQAVELNFVG